jgi:hypothetical protein
MPHDSSIMGLQPLGTAGSVTHDRFPLGWRRRSQAEGELPSRFPLKHSTTTQEHRRLCLRELPTMCLLKETKTAYRTGKPLILW